MRSSSQAATCYYQSTHSKVEAIPLSALLTKDTISKLTSLFSHYPFDAERQAGKRMNIKFLSILA